MKGGIKMFRFLKKNLREKKRGNQGITVIITQLLAETSIIFSGVKRGGQRQDSHLLPYAVWGIDRVFHS